MSESGSNARLQQFARRRSLYEQARVVSEEVGVRRGRFSRAPRVVLGSDATPGRRAVKMRGRVFRTLQLEGALLSAHDTRSRAVNSQSTLWEINVRDVEIRVDQANETIVVLFAGKGETHYRFDPVTFEDEVRESAELAEDDTFSAWQAALDAAANSKVDDFYSIGEQIGSGAYAKVYCAVGKRTGKRYAVKVIEKSSTYDAQQFEFLAAEVSVMRTVLHPQLIRTYDIFDAQDALQIVQPLMEGGELFDRVAEKGRFSELNAQRVMRDILRGVHYLHMLGVTHRDIKPENVLCHSKDWPLQVVLCDFGLSSISAESLPAANKDQLKVVGTVAYVAPEMARREETTKAVDLWSCGVLLYVLLTGKQPFAGKDDEEVLAKIAKGSYSMMPRDWRKISTDAKSLVKSLLQVDPEKRLTAAGALQHRWLYAEDVTDEPIENDLSALHSSRRKLRKAVFATQGLLKLSRSLKIHTG